MKYEGIYIPLQGRNGVRPKAPAVGAWQSPGYKGFTQKQAARFFDRSEYTEWYGLRCDGLVVIDCDDRAAADRWLDIDDAACQTWTRITPHGWHYIYSALDDSPTAPDADIFGGGSHIDIRAGRTSQIVYFAPGYYDVMSSDDIRPFRREWLPENYAKQIDRTDESWSEMPDGRGNNTMAAFAGAFRKQGMDLPTIAKCLGAINRITMTADPMPVEMVVEIARSVSRYAAKPTIDFEIKDD